MHTYIRRAIIMSYHLVSSYSIFMNEYIKISCEISKSLCLIKIGCMIEYEIYCPVAMAPFDLRYESVAL